MFKKPLFWIAIVLVWVWWEASWMWGTYYEPYIPQRLDSMTSHGMRTTDAERAVVVEVLSGWGAVLLGVIVIFMVARKLFGSGGQGSSHGGHH